MEARMRAELRALALFLLCLLVPAAQAAPKVEYSDPIDHFFHPFLYDLKAEAADAKKAGKTAIMVMYEFEDCPYCARMKREVLSRSDVQGYYRKHFQLFQIDTLGDQTVTGFDGKNLLEKKFALAAGVNRTPTFIFYSLDDGRPLVTYVGGLYDPQQFMLLGKYVVSGAYRSHSFAQYLKSQKGS
jgi:thioredoxin-related protein